MSIKRTASLGILNTVYPSQLILDANSNLLDSVVKGIFQEATNCTGKESNKLMNTYSMYAHLKEGRRAQAMRLISTVKDDALSIDFQYRSTEQNKTPGRHTDDKLVKLVEAIATIPKHARRGRYFDWRDERLRNFLISKFNEHKNIALIKVESYEYFAIISNANWIMLMLEFEVFTNVGCRTRLFEILDALSPFTGGKRKLYSAGCACHFYYRNYIVFHLLYKWYHPEAKIPTQKRFDFSTLGAMPDDIMQSRPWVWDTLNAHHTRSFIGTIHVYDLSSCTVW